jgi:phosphate transport system substrate-binding protein
MIRSIGIICLAVYLACLLLVWKPYTKKVRRTAMICLVGAVAVYCGGVAGFMAYDESITFSFLDSYSRDISLEEYEPFREDTLAKSLDEPSLLHLRDNLPRLEGATARYPVYAAFARAVYPEGEYSVYNKGDSIITCSSTTQAFNLLIDGETDVVFLMGVSKEQEEMALERGLELKLTPIGREAFVFFVNRRNSVSNLTVEDVRSIYSGQTTNWREVGGKNNLIRPYQRNENSGSQTMLLEVMGDTPLMTPPQTDVYNMMMGMYKAVAVYKNYKNSLGYSFMYYLNDMIAEDKIKLLSINGVPPTTANIAGGEYPLASEFYAITVIREPESELDAERINNTDIFIEWIQSPQGQSLIEKTGYTPLR